MKIIETIKKAKKGDDEAFSELIGSYKDKMYKIAFAYLKNEQNSLDAVSETIYKAYMNINKLKTPEFFNTWIIKILMNSCRNILKTNKRVIYIDEYDEVNNSEDSLEIELKIVNDIDLYNTIDKLSEKFKSVVILKYLEDMTITQISEVLDFPEGTVKVYLRRALASLKIQLGEECVLMISKHENGFDKINISNRLDKVVEDAIKGAKKAKKKNIMKLRWVC